MNAHSEEIAEMYKIKALEMRVRFGLGQLVSTRMVRCWRACSAGSGGNEFGRYRKPTEANGSQRKVSEGPGNFEWRVSIFEWMGLTPHNGG